MGGPAEIVPELEENRPETQPPTPRAEERNVSSVGLLVPGKHFFPLLSFSVILFYLQRVGTERENFSLPTFNLEDL